MFHGQGGYDWNTVYNMPIWLRKLTFNKIKEYYEKKNEEETNQTNMLANKTNSKSILRPNITSYNVKTAKK